jgi:lipoate-protein ligase A
LSLGYGQQAQEIDWDAIGLRGWQVVRRMTGGRAILHTDELTYSVTLPLDHPLAQGDVVQSYRTISSALLRALVYFGAHPAAEPSQTTEPHRDPVCFEMPSHYEITVEGRKLIGSAQARKHGGLLQHGTLPLHGDLGRICDVLVYVDAGAREAAKARLSGRAVTLETVLGQVVDWKVAADAVVAGFRETFALDFEVSEISTAEAMMAQKLAVEVYGTEAWTRKR